VASNSISNSGDLDVERFVHPEHHFMELLYDRHAGNGHSEFFRGCRLSITGGLINICKFMAALFIIEILFNMIEGNGLIELADLENVILVLIIFEIEYRELNNELNMAFEFIHVSIS
jgi:hypothetical protein